MIMSANLQKMDETADRAITGWSAAALGANLLPPPLDVLAVGVVFAKLGQRLAKIYGVEMDWSMLVKLGRGIARGVGAVAAASYLGTGLFKYVPGVNIWVALLIQPPMVAAMAYSAGQAFKRYFHVYITRGEGLTPGEVQDLAEDALRSRLSSHAI
jgi:uncharacterized protein (DUF697 family)